MPDWIRMLAEECDTATLRGIAEKLGVSPASVSLAINRQRSSLEFIRLRVEINFMAATVACPILGDIETTECLREQQAPYSAANPLCIKLFRACRSGCPHYKGAPK